VVASGNGCLAALDPADGRAIWARSYDSVEQGDLAREANPILAVRGLALVLAPDSDKTLLVRVADGSISDSKPRLFGGRLIIGMAGGLVVRTSETGVLASSIGAHG